MIAVLGWAVFLACSWMWCIGLYLPMLLVRDHGPWAFVALAVPNVLGAAAVGVVLRTPQAAKALRERHAPAVHAFSLVTIAFQLVFLLTIARRSPIGLELVLGAAVVAAIVSLMGRRAGWALAAGLVALAAVGYWACRGTAAIGTPTPREPSLALAAMAPAIALGFIACPYLDATFLRARAAMSPRAGAAAFTIGLGLVFAPMLALSLAMGYDPREMAHTLAASSLPAVLLAAHVVAQLGFTLGAHAAATRPRRGTPWRRVVVLVLGVAAIMTWQRWADARGLVHAGLSPAELVYRVFVGFYALVFPAYVWLCVVPTRDGRSGVLGPGGRRKRLTCALVIGAAAPMFWMGFIEAQEWWLVPGVALVLLSRLVVQPPDASEPR